MLLSAMEETETVILSQWTGSGVVGRGMVIHRKGFMTQVAIELSFV